jgi:peptidoglycan/xylan/chitin deacetylase (PgdA/CDA1 family)
VLTAAGGLLLAACGTAAKRRTPAAAASATSTAGPLSSPIISTRAPAPPAGARVVHHAATGRPEVALTFHGSGEPALAVQLLDEAERAGAKVTVFAVGTWLVAHPEMAKRILHGGHALGNHTFTHPTLHRLSTAGINDEVSRCAAVIRRLTGSPGAAFRPSGGPSITPPMVTAATHAGYGLVLGYDVDPSDNLDPGATAVAARVLKDVKAGSVVSLHLGHRGTVDALPHILTGLRARGLSAVTAPRLVAPR